MDQRCGVGGGEHDRDGRLHHVSLWSAAYEQLLTFIGFTLGLSAAATVVGLMVLRRREGSGLAINGLHDSSETLGKPSRACDNSRRLDGVVVDARAEFQPGP